MNSQQPWAMRVVAQHQEEAMETRGPEENGAIQQVGENPTHPEC